MALPRKKRSAQHFADRYSGSHEDGRGGETNCREAEQHPVAARRGGSGCFGGAVLEHLLTPQECDAVAAMYADGALFRSRVVMARHGFGSGEYKYFSYPLPAVVECLGNLYPRLAPIANRWNETLRIDVQLSGNACRIAEALPGRAGSSTTPLLLQYGEADYNCLHQDLYGEHVFALQLAVLLTEPRQDFTGGDFVLIEQRPRMQSRAEVVPLRRRCRCVRGPSPAREGARGDHRVNLRHGVSPHPPQATGTHWASSSMTQSSAARTPQFTSGGDSSAPAPVSSLRLASVPSAMTTATHGCIGGEDVRVPDPHRCFPGVRSIVCSAAPSSFRLSARYREAVRANPDWP